jgi:hypothetical protein
MGTQRESAWLASPMFLQPGDVAEVEINGSLQSRGGG